MIVRTLGTVRAGVYFFPPPVFLRQKPRRQQRECLMVMPANPIANLILGQPRIALGPLQALLDPMLGFGHAGKLRQRRFRQRRSKDSNRASSFHRSALPAESPGSLRDRCDADRVFAWTRVFTACTTSGPLAPSRTSIVVQAFSGNASRQRSTRTKGTCGRGPRPLYSGASACKSRTKVFDGTASRYCSPRARKSRRNAELRPISSSPAIQA